MDFFRRIADWPSPTVKKIWRIFRPVLVILIGAAVTYGLFTFALNYVLQKYVMPVDSGDATPIEFVVQSNDSASQIANMLYSAGGEEGHGLIANKAVFKIYVDFAGKANKLKAGTYILSRNMGIGQIVDILTEGNPPKQTLKFKIQEGHTILRILSSLKEAGLTVDETEFLALCNDREQYAKYFLETVPENTPEHTRDYMLEGYLFPDTYEAYIDADANAIISRMLSRFNEIFTASYVERAAELNMTIDEVVTLASVIEREASADTDFAKVAAVFHNRLNKGQKLESCATLQYVHKDQPPKLEYTQEERSVKSGYNTYLNSGLPVGPIGNPGKKAIEAALYPDETFIEEGYLYFCTKDPNDENKELAFAKTYEEHQKNVETYRKYW